MSLLDVAGDEKDVISLANSMYISFYDASYVHYAGLLGLDLVTEDQRLVNKVGKQIKAVGLTDI
jgi:predicted nucleic acid-binding protein